MHTGLVKVGLGRSHIPLRAETNESITEEVDPQGLDRGDEHVDPEVELEAVDEEGALDVHLRHHILVGGHVIDGPGEEDASALAACVGFDDEYAATEGVAMVVELIPEIAHLGGEHPGPRVEAVLPGEGLLHPVQVLPESVLPRDVRHAGEVVDHLPGQDGPEPFMDCGDIDPVDVHRALDPFVAHQPPAQSLRGIQHDLQRYFVMGAG